MSAQRPSGRRTRSIGAIFAWPLLIGMLSLVGLVIGLTGDGARDLIAWLLLGSTIVAIAIAILRACKPGHLSRENPTGKPTP